MAISLNGSASMVNNVELKKSEFQFIREMVYEYCGINLQQGKEALVRGRLMKRLRALQLSSFKEYLEYLETDTSNQEFIKLIDILTTNKTSFFRENNHFNYINNHIIPAIGNKSAKWWSAGCSTGEEAITLAISLRESQTLNSNSQVKILATDLSTEVLQIARKGAYEESKLKDIPKQYLKKYFSKDKSESLYYIKNDVKDMITYGRLNLLDHWPMRGPFDLIMCRNVMIYFDKMTQGRLVERFYNILAPGGFLFIGHSESISNKSLGFRAVQPAAYQKI